MCAEEDKSQFAIQIWLYFYIYFLSIIFFVLVKYLTTRTSSVSYFFTDSKLVIPWSLKVIRHQISDFLAIPFEAISFLKRPVRNNWLCQCT
jgi:hypothetical protein